MNVSTSTDVVTEKIFLQPKRTSAVQDVVHSTKERKKNKIDLQIFATKTYVTTYTSFTTILQADKNKFTSTIISSQTRKVENVVTETINPNLFNSLYVSSLKGDIKKGTETVVKDATLLNGDKLHITAVNKKKINPTKVMPIEKTKMVTTPISTPLIESSNPNIITGSTIIFFDDDSPFDATPALALSTGKVTKTANKNNLGSLLSTEIVKKNPMPTKRHASTTSSKPSLRATTPKSKTKSVTTRPPKKKPIPNISKPTEAPDLLGLGSINTFQVLKPVINAMAGLIKTNMKHTNRNDTSTTTPFTPTDAQNRSPIYIPIGDQLDDVEIAESQNLATIHINEWETNNGKTPQESPLVNGGIPISPGQIITANSDVIVGRPGRIGPRIPTIPLNGHQNDIMRPPPIWPKTNEIRKEEYIRPTPQPKLPLRPQNFIRGEKHTILDQKRHRVPQNLPSRQGTHIQFDAPILAKPVHEFKIEASIPLMLPEVIERSTGQPLLVNLQPSQVAFLNIPHNRTTALLYGGSVEPHKNGQYFDDPIPYPIPEFSVLKQVSTQKLPMFEVANQKYVGGLIKVATNVINNNPDVSIDGSSHIHPSKPINQISNSEIGPISFEMIENGGDFNAHIVNHDDVILQPPPPPYSIHTENYVPVKNLVFPVPSGVNFNYQTVHPLKYNSSTTNNLSRLEKVEGNTPVYINHAAELHQNIHTSPIITGSHQLLNVAADAGNDQVLLQKHEYHNKIPIVNELKEYLTPPRLPPKLQHSPSSKPRPPFYRQQIPLSIRFDEHKPLLMSTTSSIVDDLEDGDYHKEDDLVNEDGEVIQESISRPLRPGQIPQEVLDKYYQNASIPISQNVNFGIKVVGHDHDVFPHKPIIQIPRPFVHYPQINHQLFVRPENQLTNQVDTVDSDINHSKKTNITLKPATKKFYASTPKGETPISNNNSMYVTSMPINTQLSTHKSRPAINLQTEKPFNLTLQKNTTKLSLANSNSQTTTSNYESQMEIMKPPPPPKLHQDMQPPKIELNLPSNEIHKEFKPIVDVKPPPTIQSPIIPPKVTENEVVGLLPPPLKYPTTTHRIIEYKYNITTYRPIEKNPPRPIHPYTFEIPSTTTSTTKRHSIFTRKPFVTPAIRTSTNKITTTDPTLLSSKSITTSASSKRTTMNLDVSTTKSVKKANVSTISVQAPSASKSKTETSSIIVQKTENTVDKIVSTTSSYHLPKESEVKITNSDNAHFTTTPPLLFKPSLTQPITVSKVVPTKYVTHTETTTVTITKTTVTNTRGGPPSTMTLLVTTTEKLTKIDTVTEFHTLVQPTNIIETVTTTINQIPILHNSVNAFSTIEPTFTFDSSTSPIPIVTEDDLEEFIIRDTDSPPTKSEKNTTVHIPNDNDSILVVITDKKNNKVLSIPESETELRDDIPNNEVNHILLGGILIDAPPSLDTREYGDPDKCTPECKANKNELCQKLNGLMRCVCRPGFARMFLDHPCKPTYTYVVKLVLERNGKESLRFNASLSDKNSTEFNRLAKSSYEALDRMVMQSDLRDIYHGVQVHNFEPFVDGNGLYNQFYLQLSDNIEQQNLEDVFKKYLSRNNYSLGGTDLYASNNHLENLLVADFDECQHSKYHDCSDHAHCFNMPGTYTCSCKEGFSDLSENPIYPGRVCSAELIGCERCHYHGTCYTRGDEQILCECFHWYTGEYCHINLKVLLIALGTLGSLLLILLFICIILTCCRKKPHHASHIGNMNFIPQRLAIPTGRRGTLDRRLMIQDNSSEGSQSDTNSLPIVQKKHKRQNKSALKKCIEHNLAFSDQKDRSLPVVIPRAKYHPAPPTCITMAPVEKRKSSAASSNETKLLSYLDVGPNPNKIDSKRKHSNTESYLDNGKLSGGALVSAGFEVSATVGCGMGTLGTIATTCGTEADRSENATLIQKISADLLSSTGTQSQFTTFRKSLLDENEDPLANWLELAPKVPNTVSEARSYDETTIQVPTKSYRGGYDSKTSSQHQNDEANTMAERDVGSTFLLPHTHLYKRERGSDASGFDSL